ncbi:hypothetical protein J3F83DRAFT_357808 [Trichoderma novae-zelandiae]
MSSLSLFFHPPSYASRVSPQASTIERPMFSMAQPKHAFEIDGKLLELWNDAQQGFLASTGSNRTVKEDAEYEPRPEEWLKTFKRERHDESKKFLAACTRVGSHLQAIQTFVRVAGFSVSAASSAVPAASPASLVVNAFAWLFDSFAKVSNDYDKIEMFFGSISKIFGNLSIISNHLEQLAESDELHQCIVELFICCLNICKLASEQVHDRIRKWLRQLGGGDKLDDELEKLNAAEKQLRDCISTMTLKVGLDVKSGMRKLLRRGDSFERGDILDWLSPLDFSRVHQELKEGVSTTGVAGRWLLRSELFKRWRDEDVDRLWYVGKPGAGKSVLASIIVDHLEQQAHEICSNPGDVLVAYLYLSYKSNLTSSDLLGSVLRQFQGRSDIHPEILNKYQEYEQRGKYNGKVQRPSPEELMTLLSEYTRNKTVFIVVDAMDEFSYNNREPLINHLQGFKNDAKILVTSRDLNHLDTLQKGFETEKIEAHDEDMDEYIQEFLESCPNREPLKEYHDEIRSQVKRKSGKMFLIVRLHMDALADVEVEAEVEQVLQKLPDTIDGAYENTMDRIRNRGGLRKDRAESTLAWVAYALRPLSIHELQHALAISGSPGGIEKKYLRQQNEIISDCCGLVIQDLDGIVRYVHYSAQDYFHRIRTERFPSFDKQITIACAKYLSIPEIQQLIKPNTVRNSSLSGLRTPGDYPFLKYAGQYLHTHHRSVQATLQEGEDTELVEVIRELVASEASRTLYSCLVFSLNVYDTSSTVLDDANQNAKRRPRTPLEPFHVAVFLGSSQLVSSLIDEDGAVVDALDPYHQSALIVAIKSGLDEIASILLGNGAKVDLSTKKGHVILLYAMERDYKKMVQQVIGSPIGGPLDEGFLRIIGLLMLYLLAVLQVLLSQLPPRPKQQELPVYRVQPLDPDVGEKLDFDRSLEKHRRFLHLTYTGNQDSLLLMLEPSTIEPIDLRDVPVEDEPIRSTVRRRLDTEDSETEASYDSDSDDGESVGSMDGLSSDDDADVEGSDGGDNSHSELDDGESDRADSTWGDSDANEPDERKRRSNQLGQPELWETPPEAIRTEGLRNIDMAYLERRQGFRSFGSGLSVGRSDSQSSDAHIAVNEDVILEWKAESTSRVDSIKKTFLRTACFVAIEQGHHEVVKLFLDFGISPDLRNFHGQSLLHRATARNDLNMVKLLLAKGVTVDQRDDNGRTALMANADMKRKKVLELLVKHGADMNLEHREGCHELYEAAVYGATEVVRFFLENGTNPSITNHFGWTPLHGAAANGHLQCVKLLLDKGANPSPISDTGLTPRDFVRQGLRHYDHILTGEAHYKAQAVGTKKASVEEQQRCRDDIMEFLVKKGALTSDALYEKIGEEEFLYGKGGQYTHPGWGFDGMNDEMDGEDDDEEEEEEERVMGWKRVMGRKRRTRMLMRGG